MLTFLFDYVVYVASQGMSPFPVRPATPANKPVLSLIKCSDIQPTVIRTLVGISQDATYSLRADVEEVAYRISALSTPGGEAALGAWKLHKREEVKRQREVDNTQFQHRLLFLLNGL